MTRPPLGVRSWYEYFPSILGRFGPWMTDRIRPLNDLPFRGLYLLKLRCCSRIQIWGGGWARLGKPAVARSVFFGGPPTGEAAIQRPGVWAGRNVGGLFFLAKRQRRPQFSARGIGPGAMWAGSFSWPSDSVGRNSAPGGSGRAQYGRVFRLGRTFVSCRRATKSAHRGVKVGQGTYWVTGNVKALRIDARGDQCVLWELWLSGGRVVGFYSPHNAIGVP